MNDKQRSKPFDDFRNIVVGSARVIFEGDTWYPPTGWRLPGGTVTQNRDEAYAYALEINRLMGGVQVTN